MKWILVLFWAANGQPVINHIGFESQEICEQRLSAMHKVFEMMDESAWAGVCQIANPGAAR
jgi:hypothetical protein